MASTTYYTILTKVGQAKIANAIAYGRQLQITQFALGDGGGSGYEPDESQTALKNEVYRANVSNVIVSDENINMLEVNMAVPADQGGWVVREMGIYDTDGDLIAISKTPDDPKPGAGSGAAKDVVYRLFIVVANTDAVEIKIDPTVAVATKAEVQAVSERVKRLESGLIVYASPTEPTTAADNYLWLQVLRSSSAEVEPTLLKTSTETDQGYHVSVDKHLEHIDNVAADAAQAKADDVIILEV